MAKKPHRPHNFRALSKPKPIKKHEHRHYSPYIPLLILVVSTMLIGLLQPIQKRGILSYATSMSHSQLLSATNEQRRDNGIGALAINNTLSSAAQEKANDMVKRNYWSHNTPDGQEPWVFMNNVGYKYTKAGENLAYGFLTSNDTVSGWMNSPSHKANLLDSAFTEVGFGYANGEDFNGSGPETVVVAMYAKPHVLASSNTQPAPTPAPTANVADNKPSTSSPAETNAQLSTSQTQPITTDNPVINEPASKQIAKIQTLTGGYAPWASLIVGMIAGVAMTLLLVKHTVRLRHLIRNSEEFILHHTFLDSVLISLIALSSFMSQTSGFIR